MNPLAQIVEAPDGAEIPTLRRTRRQGLHVLRRVVLTPAGPHAADPPDPRIDQPPIRV